MSLTVDLQLGRHSTTQSPMSMKGERSESVRHSVTDITDRTAYQNSSIRHQRISKPCYYHTLHSCL